MEEEGITVSSGFVSHERAGVRFLVDDFDSAVAVAGPAVVGEG